jgi:catechol 2,3-dioxygenase-like lactoylglutathione lyase family enzyme
MPLGIKGVSMLSVYAVDLEASVAFYRDVLGLTDVQPMGARAAYIRFGTTADGNPFGLYLIGGNEAAAGAEKPARTTFAFDVPSARETFEHLKAHGVATDLGEPMDMGGGWFWFTAYDPSGLPIEFLGQA